MGDLTPDFPSSDFPGGRETWISERAGKSQDPTHPPTPPLTIRFRRPHLRQVIAAGYADTKDVTLPRGCARLRIDRMQARHPKVPLPLSLVTGYGAA